MKTDPNLGAVVVLAAVLTIAAESPEAKRQPRNRKRLVLLLRQPMQPLVTLRPAAVSWNR
jgi:hypothetical protein